jgi:hypothetical protein
MNFPTTASAHEKQSSDDESERLRLVSITNKQRRLPIQLRAARIKLKKLETEALELGMGDLLENQEGAR